MNNKTRNILLLALLLTNGADARKLVREPNKQNQGAPATGNPNKLLQNLIQNLGDPNKTQTNENNVKTLDELRQYAKDALGRNKGLDLNEFLGAALGDLEKDKTFKNQKRLDNATVIAANTTLSELKADLDKINKTAGVMKAVMDANHFGKLLKNSDLKSKVFADGNDNLIDALSGLNNTATEGVNVKLSNNGDGDSVEDAMKTLKPLTDALAEFVSSNPELMGKAETEKFLAMHKRAEKLNNSLKSEADKAKEVAVYAKAIGNLLEKPVQGMDLFAGDTNIDAIKQGEEGVKNVTLLNYMKELSKNDSVYTKRNARDLARVQKTFADMESKARTSILKRKGLDGDLKTFVKSNMARVDKNLDGYMNALRNANFGFDADIGNKAFSKAMEELTAEKIKKAADVDTLQQAFKTSFDKEFDRLLSPVKYNIHQFLTYAKEKDAFSGLGTKNMGERKALTKVYKDDAGRNLGDWS